MKPEYVVQLANNQLATQTDHVNSFYAGVGYTRHIGRRGLGGISIQVLYNFLYLREDNSLLKASYLFETLLGYLACHFYKNHM